MDTSTTQQAALTADLAEKLANVPGICCAYLFGSQARGTARPDSDIDVAVLFADDSNLLVRQADLSSRLGPHVDIVVLNSAPVALAYRVLRDGILILSRDDTARVAHKARTLDRYIDMAPMRETLAAGLRHRVEEGRFGRP